MKVYVLTPDYGWDGLGEPIGVFKSMQDVESFVERVDEWRKRMPVVDKFKYHAMYMENLEVWENEMPPNFPQYCEKYEITCLEME